MFEFIAGAITLLASSIGLIVGCIVGLFVSYIVYVALSGHEGQIVFSALAYLSSIIVCLVVEVSYQKK